MLSQIRRKPQFPHIMKAVMYYNPYDEKYNTTRRIYGFNLMRAIKSYGLMRKKWGI